MASSTLPDFYKILGVEPTATPDQIKTAYKKKSLIAHPDRLPQGSSEERRKLATQEFQSIADAYYTLSDSGRRSAYDRLYKSRPASSRNTSPGSSKSYFETFMGAAPGGSSGARAGAEQPDAEFVFSDVFEDLLTPEVHRAAPFWTWTGAVAGAALGFIAGNVPGAVIAGWGGSRLGAIRDAKGKAVYEVFKELGSEQKAEVLKALIAKVFGMAGIGGNISA